MTHKLIPRYSTGQAAMRIEEIQNHLADGRPISELVLTEPAGAVPNPTGGEAASSGELGTWRHGVLSLLHELPTGSKSDNDIHGIQLGKALSSVIDPSPSDAASDGAWSFLALSLFPDVVLARWPAHPITHELSRDRWIGRQAGRDRNYLKLAWRRWQVLGPVMEAATAKLGEDEFGALLERSAVARNVRLVQVAAKEIIAFSDDGARTEFARALMKRVTYQTGPLDLNILTTRELAELVRTCATEVLSLGAPRRAMPARPRSREAQSVPAATDVQHSFTELSQPGGKVRLTCSCGFAVRRRRAGVERVVALHKLHPTMTDTQLSQL